MNWLIFTFGTFICLGIFQILQKLGAGRLEPVAMNFFYQGTAALLMTSIFLYNVLISGKNYSLNKAGLLFAILMGLLIVFSNLFLFTALKNGPVSRILPIVSMSFAVAVIFGFLVLNEPFTWKIGLGLGFAVASVFLLSS
ncbi:EamA family transporter [Candidatus Woesearchaeota archaeon]|nr:EamA family transporter [Candidatus Woesearchaeota archaeon]